MGGWVKIATLPHSPTLPHSHTPHSHTPTLQLPHSPTPNSQLPTPTLPTPNSQLPTPNSQLLKMIITLICLSLISAATIAFFSRRGLRYLRYFQQEEYNWTRFQDWLFKNRAFDTKGSIVAAIAAVLTAVLTGGNMSLCLGFVFWLRRF